MAPAESSDDDDVSTSPLWHLGFLDKPQHQSSLLRHKFPSKVGGRPAWLNPVDLPKEEELLSQPTGQPLDFLLQVYCPLDDNEQAFHRTIFVFAPREGKDLTKTGSIRAFRCQLSRQNSFYAYSPSKDRYPQKVQETTRDPWAVIDSESCLAKGEPLPPPQNRTLFPEFQLLTESEEPPSQPPSPTSRSQEADAEGPDAVQASDVTPDVEEAIASTTTPEQKHFAEFAARVSWDPEQVLRYSFQEGAEPLWPSPSPVPSDSDIPPCQNCSARRRFEFQVMPQLLLSLDLNEEHDSSLNWGTVAVYSCSASCQGTAAYLEEFVYVQPEV